MPRSYHPFMNSHLTERERLRKIKSFAHMQVFKAIRAGVLVRPSACSYCGREGRIEAHHEDHSKPLEITWLCHSCNLRLRSFERTHEARLNAKEKERWLRGRDLVEV